MSVSPDGGLAAKVSALVLDAEALAALSRTNPHLFFEQKDGLVQRLKELHADVRDGEGAARDRRPPRDTVFRPGRVVSRKGRVVVAEVRRARVFEARRSPFRGDDDVEVRRAGVSPA